MFDSKAIGERIKEARRACGMKTRDALAKALREKATTMHRKGALPKLSQQTVQHWEAGKVIPPWDKVELLAGVFGPEHGEDWIMFGSRRAQQLSHERPLLSFLTLEERSLVNDFRLANDTGKGHIVSAAKAFAKEFPADLGDLRPMRRKTDQ